MSPTADPAGPFDLVTMGRIGVDLYPHQTGVGLEDVETFGKYLGGSATNVAVAAARHGRRTAVVSRTGADPFGRWIHRALRGFGVDDRWVTEVARYPTPITFCEIFPPDDFPLYFYREPKAPDLEIHPEELDLAALRDARVFWMTGTGLSQEPSRAATLAALAARDRPEGRGGPGVADGCDPAAGRATVFDLDWRPMFWESRQAARPCYRQALRHATVAVGNLDECETAVGTRDPDKAAAALLDLGVRLAVVKQGPAGVLAATPTRTVTVPPVAVEVVNGLGAGDAFGGALCHGLLADWDLEQTVRFANAAGAVVAGRLACSSAMPTTAEAAAAAERGAAPGRGDTAGGAHAARPGGAGAATRGPHAAPGTEGGS